MSRPIQRGKGEKIQVTSPWSCSLERYSLIVLKSNLIGFTCELGCYTSMMTNN